MSSMRHTGAPDCPQGCWKVLLKKLKVPEALRAFHPTPRWGDLEEDCEDDANI